MPLAGISRGREYHVALRAVRGRNHGTSRKRAADLLSQRRLIRVGALAAQGRAREAVATQEVRPWNMPRPLMQRRVAPFRRSSATPMTRCPGPTSGFMVQRLPPSPWWIAAGPPHERPVSFMFPQAAFFGSAVSRGRRSAISTCGMRRICQNGSIRAKPAPFTAPT